MLGQSVRRRLISTWARDLRAQIRCLLLASPAFQVKLYVPFARPDCA